MERIIAHIDMDSFFASIEQMDHPELKGKPVVVGGDHARGVIAAASYEARKFGVHSAMPSVTARKLCPNAVFVRGHHKRYGELSRVVMETIRRFSPVVDPVSIDEASCDLTGTDRLWGNPEDTARSIKAAIQESTGGLVASVGMGPNRFVAKIASDLNKPDGLLWIPKKDIREKLYPLPIRKVWGIGPKSEKQFIGRGITTIGKLMEWDPAVLERTFGDGIAHILKLIAGQEVRLTLGQERKSVSNEMTFEKDLEDFQEIHRHLQFLTEKVCGRLRAHGLRGKTIQLKIRFTDFSTFTRSQSLTYGSHLAQEIQPLILELLSRVTPMKPVRLLGVGVSALINAPDSQMDLFAQQRNRQENAAQAMDEVNRKFGKHAVTKAELLPLLDKTNKEPG